jgi:hypothetical protein
VRALGADVAEFQHPLAAQIALHGEIPLLRIRHDKVPRDFQHKQILRGVHAGSARAGVSSVGNGRTAAGRKADEMRQAR